MSWFFANSGASAPPEIAVWMAGISGAGGSLTGSSETIATDLMVELNAATYRSKIKWLLPLLGADIIAARMPLIDDFAAGICGNTGFLDADFSEATGLQGNGSKHLDTNIKAADLDSPAIEVNGGMGLLVLAAGGASFPWMMGSRDAGLTQIFGLAPFSGGEIFMWGDGNSDTSTASAAGANDYYGQRAGSSDRKLYKDGVQIATDTDTPPAHGAGTNNVMILGIDASFRSDGRIGGAYMTDGTLTPTEIADLHTALDTYLLTPTGR